MITDREGLTITDVVMPQMGGARLAGELATECPAIRVLFVSGYAQTTVQRHGAIDMTSRFRQKPFSLMLMGSAKFSTLRPWFWRLRPSV